MKELSAIRSKSQPTSGLTAAKRTINQELSKTGKDEFPAFMLS